MVRYILGVLLLVMKIGHRINSVDYPVIDNCSYKELRITVFLLRDKSPARTYHILTFLVAHSVFYIVILLTACKYSIYILLKCGSVLRMYERFPHTLRIIYILSRKSEIVNCAGRPLRHIRFQITHKYIISYGCRSKCIKYPVCLAEIPVMWHFSISVSHGNPCFLLHAFSSFNLRMLCVEPLLVFIHPALSLIHNLINSIRFSLPHCSKSHRCFILLIYKIPVSGYD